MEAAYVSAFFGLAGVSIGAISSFATTWLTQNALVREKRLEASRMKREALFDSFIAEATKLYGDALGHEKDDIDDLVIIYAILARMSLVSTQPVLEAGERVVESIIETYQQPSMTLSELRRLADQGKMNLLKKFSERCRAELDNY